MQFTQEHAEIRRTLRAIIDKDINPHVDKWEEDEIFPAHEVFKKLGDAGLLGIHKPTESKLWLHPSNFAPVLKRPIVLQILLISFVSMAAFVMMEALPLTPNRTAIKECPPNSKKLS